VHWDSFQPNFYMIFQPGTLQGLPATYLTSFYLAPGHDQEVVALSRAFPAVTILQVDALLDQLRSILAQVTLAVEYVLLFVLAAGWRCCSPACRHARRTHSPGRLLRALGAAAVAGQGPAYRIRIAGRRQRLLAALGCELITWVLYRYAFDLHWARIRGCWCCRWRRGAGGGRRGDRHAAGA
jgi:putative ABC transport system permease protein